MTQRNWIGACAAAWALFLSAAHAADNAPALGLPLECTLGQDCFVQHYVDRDDGPAASAFNCSPQTYDAHTGTDFRLADFSAMRSGVSVLAAASGLVTATRNGEADGGGTPETTQGRECGNGVLVRHDAGWTTQYCHLMRGSVLVAPGDMVTRGQSLGLVGYSGLTDFPHLHFVLRRDGAIVDPYSMGPATCTATPRQAFDPPLPVQRGGILSMGFAEAVPDYDAVREGTADTGIALTPGSPALVGWVQTFGMEPGDRIELVLRGPDGQIARSTHRYDRQQAQGFRATGKRRRASAWARGEYTLSVSITRGRNPVAQADKDLTLR